VIVHNDVSYLCNMLDDSFDVVGGVHPPRNLGKGQLPLVPFLFFAHSFPYQTSVLFPQSRIMATQLNTFRPIDCQRDKSAIELVLLAATTYNTSPLIDRSAHLVFCDEEDRWHRNWNK